MRPSEQTAELSEAVKQDGRALQFADAPLRADRDIVFQAVKQVGDALQLGELCCPVGSRWTLRTVHFRMPKVGVLYGGARHRRMCLGVRLVGSAV